RSPGAAAVWRKPVERNSFRSVEPPLGENAAAPGERRLAALQPAYLQAVAATAGQTDLRVERPGPRLTTVERYGRRRAQADEELAQRPGDPNARFRRAEAAYYLGDFEPALEALDEIISQKAKRRDNA